MNALDPHERSDRAALAARLLSRRNAIAASAGEGVIHPVVVPVLESARPEHQFFLDTILFLAEAVEADAPELFVDYLAWSRSVLIARGVTDDELSRRITSLRSAATAELSPTDAATIDAFLGAASGILESTTRAVSDPGTIANGSPVSGDELSELAHEYLDRLLAADRAGATRLILDAVDSGVPIREIYLDVFERSQIEIGRRWQLNRVSIAQEHYCTAATQLIMGLLYEHVFDTPRIGRSLVATCVAGALHEIGLRIVSDFFEMEGWDTYYLGANVPPVDVVRAVADRGADLLAVSVTLTPHLRAARELVTAVRESSSCAAVRILVGGPPFAVAPELWRQIGADGFARSAADAVSAGTALLESTP